VRAYSNFNVAMIVIWKLPCFSSCTCFFLFCPRFCFVEISMEDVFVHAHVSFCFSFSYRNSDNHRFECHGKTHESLFHRFQSMQEHRILDIF